MLFSYKTILPSTHIYNSFEAINAAVARATVDAHSRAPQDRFARSLHAAKYFGGLGFTAGANSIDGYFTQGVAASCVGSSASMVPGIVPTALSQSGVFVASPGLAFVAVGVAVAAAVGIGPQATARQRAAGNPVSAFSLCMQFGVLGYPEHVAAEAAKKAASQGYNKTSYAAYACALAVALVLEPLRAPLACLLVTLRLFAALMHTAFAGTCGLILAWLTENTPTTGLMPEESIRFVADLIGAEHPAPAPRPTYDWSSGFSEFDDFARYSTHGGQTFGDDNSFPFDRSSYRANSDFPGFRQFDFSASGFAYAAGHSTGFDTNRDSQSYAQYNDDARSRFGSSGRADATMPMSQSQALGACQSMLSDMRAAPDRQARYDLLETWSQSRLSQQNMAALAACVGRANSRLSNFFDDADNHRWLAAVTGASSSPQEAKTYLRQMALMLHPDKLAQQGSRLSEGAQLLGHQMYLVCDQASKIRVEQRS